MALTGSGLEGFASLPMAVGGVSDIRRENVHGCEVFFLETRMLLENFPLGHTVRQPPKNVVHCDPHSADAGFPVPLVSFDRDARVNGRHRINSLSRTLLIHAYAEWSILWGRMVSRMVSCGRLII